MRIGAYAIYHCQAPVTLYKYIHYFDTLIKFLSIYALIHIHFYLHTNYLYAIAFHLSSFLKLLIVVSLSINTASIPIKSAQSPICSAVKS